MNRIMSIFFAIVLILVSVDSIDAKTYKWKDEDGKWHFTDDASKVPQNNRSPFRRTPPREDISKPTQSDHTNKSGVDGKRPRPSHSSGKDLEKGMEEDLQKMGEALAEGLGKGMEKLGEELGKAFEGIGELVVIAEQNKPDTEKKVFENKEDEIRHDVQQVLLGMFLICQFQFILAKSETCSRDGLEGKLADGWKVNQNLEMKKKLEDYIIKIDPNKNTRRDLLIKAHHKNFGGAWEITHEGKKSLKETSRQIKISDP
ncbi:hypothetical protein UR09_03330 [Candidatus Nitromaritima sp. SCGC AAA799-A02]|nr:hypothetical protein UR09_03330 [Candidatus Nitromaritima sp. SCGC AAA799-A02]